LSFLTFIPVPGNADYSEPDITLSMSDPESWIIDTVHLGTKQLEVSYDGSDQAAIIRPTWSRTDTNSDIPGNRNIDNSKLHIYQLIAASDCTQVDAFFEISIPQEYIDEGKLEFVFSLQAGAKGDYLFNGRTFTMEDFASVGDSYKKMTVNVKEFKEPEEKQRAIERVNFIFHRNGSMVSQPIKIRRFAMDLNSEKITPPLDDVKVVNPNSTYLFSYNTEASIRTLQARISAEDMDITKRPNEDETAVDLIPQWGPGQIPAGHSGKVTLVQPLGAIHDFEQFEVQYALSIPEAYFEEGKLDIYLFIQAGLAGFDRWSGTQRPLSSFADKAGRDIVLTMTEKDFQHQGKKRNQIEVVGLQLNPHGSTITEPIILKSIIVKLPE